MSDIVERLRDARNWLNGGECCGDKDSAGICAAPACIFGEALKELYEAADRIEQLEAALQYAFEYVGRLAVTLAEKHYTDQRFELMPNLLGRIDQIDNMTCGLTRAALAEQEENS